MMGKLLVTVLLLFGVVSLYHEDFDTAIVMIVLANINATLLTRRNA